jgi:hypothetical protein
LARDQRGLALVLTLLVVVLIAAIVAAAVTAAANYTRTTTADYRDTRTFYAAEAGAEAALSQVELALRDAMLTDAELQAIRPPELEGFDFSEFTVVKDGAVVQETITDGPWAGLYSLTQNLLISSVASDASGATGGIVLGAKAQAIPIFQFAKFFEGDYEAYAGSLIDFQGNLHANGNMYLNGNGPINYYGILTTPNEVRRDRKIEHRDTWRANIWIADASGTLNKLDFDSEDTPDPEQFKAKSEMKFDSRLKTNAFGVDSLRLPLPDGVPPRELIRPREASDTEVERVTKFAWQADMYVVVDLDNIVSKEDVCGGAETIMYPTVTVERPFGGAALDQTTMCRIFEFTFEAFYENHEERWVDVLDLDMSELRAWAINPAGTNSTQIIYVDFVMPTGHMPNPGDTNPHEGNGGGAWPVLRIHSASQLPGPLTVGSERPLYLKGDYNIIDKQPAAVFGDTYTVLSAAWDDDDWANQNNTTERWQRPDATTTTQNYSLIIGTGEGYVGCYHEDPDCVQDSEKAANQTRMLEDWSNSSHCGGTCLHTWRGSFVSMWLPVYASAYFYLPGANYYDGPDRDYVFDTDLLDPENLPPGTPSVGSVFRASFREIF